MRIAVYPGSFDPITFGHLSVVERAAQCFDHLTVLVAVNPGKLSMFTLAERVAMVRSAIAPYPNVDCHSTDGLVVTFARRIGGRFLVRGVRSATDVEAEIALAQANHELAPEIDTVFVPTRADLSGVSSSKLKELAAEGANLTGTCPPAVARILIERTAADQREVSHVEF